MVALARPTPNRLTSTDIPVPPRSDDLGNLLWVVSARDNDGQRWVAKHEDFYLAVCGLADLVGFELEDG